MGKKGPLEIITLDEFKARTSVIGRRNGPITRVDAVYAEFYMIRSTENAKKLHDALSDYLLGHGGHWANIPRDKESGGLLEWLHGRTKELAGIKTPNYVKAINTYDLPHSRFGVLYLFGNIDIDMNKWSLALEGVAAVGGAVGSEFSTNINQLKLNSSDLVDVATPLLVNSNLGTSNAPRPPPNRQLPGFPATGAMFDAISESHILMSNPFAPAAAIVDATGVVLYEAFNNLRVRLINAVEDLFNWIKNKLLSDGEWAWDVSAQVISKAVKFVVGKCLESAAPFIGGAMDLGGGILKTIKAAKESLETFFLRRKIQLVPGHPEQLANAIEADMKSGMLVGLWSMLKGVANLALSAFLPGAGSLVSALVTGVEWLVKFVWRIWEQSKISKFLRLAREHYKAERRLAEIKAMEIRLENPGGHGMTGSPDELVPDMDSKKEGIIHDLDRFRAFYKKGCDASPVIPMLTLNTGICGSTMHMMRMFDDAGNVITQDTFSAGSEYFTELKQYGRSYLLNAGFVFNTLIGGDPAVKGYLTRAVDHHTGNSSNTDKVLAFGAGFAG